MRFYGKTKQNKTKQKNKKTKQKQKQKQQKKKQKKKQTNNQSNKQTKNILKICKGNLFLIENWLSRYEMVDTHSYMSHLCKRIFRFAP